MAQSYEIADLRTNPKWIPVVASWHHSEWLKGADSKSTTSTATYVGRDASERIAKLHEHVSVQAIPSTFIAHQDGLPIGSISLVNFQFTKGHQASEWLTNFFVIEGSRSQGVGSQLLNRLMLHATQNGIQRMFLYTKDKQDFYTKRGWVFSHQGLVQGATVKVLSYCLADHYLIKKC